MSDFVLKTSVGVVVENLVVALRPPQNIDLRKDCSTKQSTYLLNLLDIISEK